MSTARIRVTEAPRPTRDVAVEVAPDARLGKHVLDVPAAWADRFIRNQQERWVLLAELAALRGDS